MQDEKRTKEAPAGAEYYPPTGTYPAPDEEPVLAQLPPGSPVQPPKKVRRVGTFTMALALIATGCLLLVQVFVPSVDLIFLARLSPIILVLLGLELLIANIRWKDGSLRYDALSIFISLVLIAGSLVAAVIPEYIWRHEQVQVANVQAAAQLSDKSRALLQEQPSLEVSSIEWYVNMPEETYSANTAGEELPAGTYIQVRIYIPGSYTGKEEFAAACRRVTDLMLTLVPHIDYASYYSYNNAHNDSVYTGDTQYTLWAENRYQVHNSADTLARDVITLRWWQDGSESGYYVDESHYQELLAWQQEQLEQERLEREEQERLEQEMREADED